MFLRAEHRGALGVPLTRVSYYLPTYLPTLPISSYSVFVLAPTRMIDDNCNLESSFILQMLETVRRPPLVHFVHYFSIPECVVGRGTRKLRYTRMLRIAVNDTEQRSSARLKAYILEQAVRKRCDTQSSGFNLGALYLLPTSSCFPLGGVRLAMRITPDK